MRVSFLLSAGNYASSISFEILSAMSFSVYLEYIIFYFHASKGMVQASLYKMLSTFSKLNTIKLNYIPKRPWVKSSLPLYFIHCFLLHCEC